MPPFCGTIIQTAGIHSWYECRLSNQPLRFLLSHALCPDLIVLILSHMKQEQTFRAVHLLQSYTFQGQKEWDTLAFQCQLENGITVFHNGQWISSGTKFQFCAPLEKVKKWIVEQWKSPFSIVEIRTNCYLFRTGKYSFQ